MLLVLGFLQPHLGCPSLPCPLWTMSPIHAALLQPLCKPCFLLSQSLCGDDESSKNAIPTLLLSPLCDLEN